MCTQDMHACTRVCQFMRRHRISLHACHVPDSVWTEGCNEGRNKECTC